eukprot:520244_1
MRYRQTHTQVTTQSGSDTHKEDTPSSKGLLIIVLIVILCPLFYYVYNKKILSVKLETNVEQTSKTTQTNTQSLPTYDTLYDTEYMYQFPANISPQKAGGIIFFAHGCSHSATDWFMSSTNCPKCIGLPEERNLISYWLEHNFIVITISSQDRISKCWTLKNDAKPIENILSSFKKKYNIEILPLFAFGASSGGSFVGSFAMNNDLINNLNIQGLIVQISAIPLHKYDLNSLKINVPILYIPMVKDERTLHMVNEQLQILKNENNKVCAVEERTINEEYFYLQINDNDSMTKELSNNIYELLKTKGYLNDNGILIESPRHSDWREVLMNGLTVHMHDNLIADQSAISEEMNVAFARHELTAQCNQQMWDFIQNIVNK